MTPLNFRRFFRDLTEFISEKELRLDRRARRELRWLSSGADEAALPRSAR
jgi:hypothetical protein